MGPEHGPQPAVAALAQQVEVQLAERRPGPVGVVEGEGGDPARLPVVGLQVVVLGPGGNRRLEDPGRVDPGHLGESAVAGAVVTSAGTSRMASGIGPVGPHDAVVQAETRCGSPCSPATISSSSARCRSRRAPGRRTLGCDPVLSAIVPLYPSSPR